MYVVAQMNQCQRCWEHLLSTPAPRATPLMDTNYKISPPWGDIVQTLPHSPEVKSSLSLSLTHFLSVCASGFGWLTCRFSWPLSQNAVSLELGYWDTAVQLEPCQIVGLLCAAPRWSLVKWHNRNRRSETSDSWRLQDKSRNLDVHSRFK